MGSGARSQWKSPQQAAKIGKRRQRDAIGGWHRAKCYWHGRGGKRWIWHRSNRRKSADRSGQIPIRCCKNATNGSNTTDQSIPFYQSGLFYKRLDQPNAVLLIPQSQQLYDAKDQCATAKHSVWQQQQQQSRGSSHVIQRCCYGVANWV